MDDDFTTGPQDDQSRVTLTSLDKRLRTIQDDLRAMVLERRELSVTLMEMNRAIMRRTPVEPLRIDRLRDEAATWEIYATLQRRMDRMDQRLEEIEKKLEPPLPPFPEFKP
jgi:hypothetical protein